MRDVVPEALLKEPIYDSDKHIVTQSIENKIVRDNGEVIYATTISVWFFYKEGAVALAFVSGTDEIGKYLSTIKNIIQSFTFDEGYEYRP